MTNSSTLYAQWNSSPVGILANSSLSYAGTWTWKNTTNRTVYLTCDLIMSMSADGIDSGYVFSYIWVNDTGSQDFTQNSLVWASNGQWTETATVFVEVPAGKYIVIHNQLHTCMTKMYIEEK